MAITAIITVVATGVVFTRLTLIKVPHSDNTQTQNSIEP
ncbi:hypothetical protein JCM19232_3325 [Vibrio ishigakensis]|uniref:Uncharacterized protein n=1 Tax=Vibrio ishigakensis TaxID=1481914 RepID=A0A0B8PMY1_9VIBR|nr:hypothetical protein JCM19232_3325 [Vibrio ishigakensis]